MSELKKSKLSDYRRVKAARLSHPNVTEDEDGVKKYSISYLVVGGTGTRRWTRPCTAEVFRKAYGYHPGNDPNTLPVGGWANLVGRQFYVYVSGKKGEEFVHAISCVPGGFYTSARNSPEAAGEQNVLELVYSKDGSYEVPWRKLQNESEVPAIPLGLNGDDFDRIVSQLDKADTVESGTELSVPSGNYRVTEIHGSRVYIRR
jgi:hypothetical protein